MYALLRLYTRQKLTVLLYHGVEDEYSLGLFNYRQKFLTPEVFREQMTYIKRHYTVLSLDTAIEHLRNGTPFPPHPLVITFDDGYRNMYRLAYPILKEYALPATVFVTTGFLDKQEPLWVDRLEYAVGKSTHFGATMSERAAYDAKKRQALKALPDAERKEALETIEHESGMSLTTLDGPTAVYAPLSWDEVREMEKHGIICGAHTVTHPILSRLTTGELTYELVESFARVRSNTKNCTNVFAYPNGQAEDVTDDVIAEVRHTGFEAALTTLPGWNTHDTNPYMLRRFTLDGTGSFMYFILTITGALNVGRTLKNHAKRSHFF